MSEDLQLSIQKLKMFLRVAGLRGFENCRAPISTMISAARAAGAQPPILIGGQPPREVVYLYWPDGKPAAELHGQLGPDAPRICPEVLQMTFDALEACQRHLQSRQSEEGQLPALDREDRIILQQLVKAPARLYTLDDFPLDRETAMNHVNDLIARGLARRPNGPKKGCQITPKGRKALQLAS